HFRGHLARGGPTIALVITAAVIQRGGLSLAESRPDPVTHVFVFARITGNTAALVDTAHAVAKADGVSDDDGACGSRSQVADDDGTIDGAGTCVEIVFAEKDPAVANHVMGYADLRFAASMFYAIQLITSIRAPSRPAINRIKARNRDIRGISS